MAPNWSRDGKSLAFTRDGRIYTIPVVGGTPQLLDVRDLSSCSGSHGFSPDGKWFALTCSAADQPDRRVYIVPATGGKPRLLTQNTGWFHSWSPDGKTILFTRGGHGSGNIYAISVDGGPETALTTGTGLSDDPDYSPDGKYIYFNTDRWGGMQIGRMLPTAASQNRSPLTISRTGRLTLRPTESRSSSSLTTPALPRTPPTRTSPCGSCRQKTRRFARSSSWSVATAP